MKTSIFKLSLFFLALLALRSARADDTEYHPQAKTIVYHSRVPSAIARSAKKVGPTRFFGSFRRGMREFAIYLYDKSAVRHKPSKWLSHWERDSRLDVFRRTEKSWQRIQSFDFTRLSQGRRDALIVKAQSLWFDPAHATIPMVHVRLFEPSDNLTLGYGFRTDVYGLLTQPTKPKAFIALDGYFPRSMSTVTQNTISFPNAHGNLTLLHIVSDISQTDYDAYNWNGKKWKMVAQNQTKNGADSDRYWNGIAFKAQKK